MRTLASLFLTLLIPFSSQALSSAVRVDLSECGLIGASQFAGVLIQQEGQYYVVTSSWAQMSSTWPGARCEKVWTTQGRLAVEPVVTDHLSGLALYKVNASLPLEVPTVAKNEASLLILKNGQPTTIPGEIVMLSSRRHFLPTIDRVMEWKGPSVPSIVIGAAVWKGVQWAGLVSHQYLKLVPGSKTVISRWDLQSSETHDHLIVIPAVTIISWLKQQLSHIQEPAVWPVSAQQRGEDQIIVGDLILSSVCPPPGNTDSSGEYPIGGNDGFGIGGDSVVNKACKMQISKSSVHSDWMPTSLQDVSANQSALNQGRSVLLWYGVRRAESELLRDYIFSTESLLKTSLKTDAQWLIERSFDDTPLSQQDLWKSSADLKSTVMHCYANLYIRDESVQDLVRKLFFYSVLASSDLSAELKVSDVETLIDKKGPYREGWSGLLLPMACDTLSIRTTPEAFANVHRKTWQP